MDKGKWQNSWEYLCSGKTFWPPMRKFSHWLLLEGFGNSESKVQWVGGLWYDQRKWQRASIFKRNSNLLGHNFQSSTYWYTNFRRREFMGVGRNRYYILLSALKFLGINAFKYCRTLNKSIKLACYWILPYPYSWHVRDFRFTRKVHKINILYLLPFFAVVIIKWKDKEYTKEKIFVQKNK